MKRHYDLVVVLGAHVGLNESRVMVPSKHLAMRIHAAGLLWRSNMVDRFILSGGYNTFVRYDQEIEKPTYGSTPDAPPKQFTELAKELLSRQCRSESSVMLEYLERWYDVWPEAVILEDHSHTTEENASCTKSIWERIPIRTIGIITNWYHMERALNCFKNVFLPAEPIIAEEVLQVLGSPKDNWRAQIAEFYQQPHDKKMWNVSQLATTSHELFAEPASTLPVNQTP